MTELMQGRPVPVDRLEISVGPRHLNVVLGRTVEGAIATHAEVGAGRGDQRLGLGQDQPLGHGRRDGDQPVGKVLALIGVEHRESFEERDRAGLVTVALRPLALVIRDEAVGIDHGGAMLAFPDVGTKAQGLAKGEPALAGKAALDDGAPEDQHIHAGVAPLGRRILRHGERCFRRGGPPGLNPGHAAGLQLSDDLVGDFGIEARPVLTGTSASG